jgi:hypothetical protein
MMRKRPGTRSFLATRQAKQQGIKYKMKHYIAASSGFSMAAFTPVKAGIKAHFNIPRTFKSS